MDSIHSLESNRKAESQAEPEQPAPLETQTYEQICTSYPVLTTALLRFADDNRARRRRTLRGFSRGGGFRGASL